MKKRGMNPKVDVYMERAENWRDELKKLRAILLDCQLTEELRWAKPCYAFEEHNVVVILPLKAHCALLFLKGSLLSNAHGLLVKAGENSEAGRQMRFTSVREIVERETVLRACIHEAIEVEKAGLKVVTKKVTELRIPAEFKSKLEDMPALKAAFDALTPGRQRAYIFHFSGAKQSATRASRVSKYLPKILKGKGLDD